MNYNINDLNEAKQTVELQNNLNEAKLNKEARAVVIKVLNNFYGLNIK